MADASWNFVFGHSDSDQFSVVTEQGTNITNFQGQLFAATPVINTAINLGQAGQGSDHQDFGLVRFGVTFSY